MRAWLWILTTSALTAGALQSQEPGAASREAMRKLAFLEGDWEGEARIQMGPGPGEHLRMVESVRYSNSGHVLIIQGTGWERDAGGAEQVAFNAVAVISHDPEAGYRMRSYTMERSGDFEVVPSDSGFTWGFDTPQGRVRYTMTLSPEGEWREVGEFSRGDAPGRQFIEMVVRKKR